MPDFPRSLIAFQRQFPDKAACAVYPVSMRWPDGFRCPACGHGQACNRCIHSSRHANCHRSLTQRIQRLPKPLGHGLLLRMYAIAYPPLPRHHHIFDWRVIARKYPAIH